MHDEAEDLKDADSLERAAADCRASERNESWLLEGTRLAEAETLAAKPGFRDRLDPTRDYLQVSRQREDDRIEAEKRRQQADHAAETLSISTGFGCPQLYPAAVTARNRRSFTSNR